MAFESPCPSLIAIEARVLAAENRRTAGLRNALTNYALERFLYRLSVSRHRDSLVLKGALLLHCGLPSRSSDAGFGLAGTSDRPCKRKFTNRASPNESRVVEISRPHPTQGWLREPGQRNTCFFRARSVQFSRLP